MAASDEDRFVRVPTKWLEALLRARLNGSQWRILLWVIRYTCGWNREWTPFTWYRVAKETGLDRAAAYRSGETLLRASVLIRHEERIALQMDSGAWDRSVFPARTDDARQLWMPIINVVTEQRQPLSADNATVAGRQRIRCQETTLFRRAKDRCKDRLKTYKDRRTQGHTLHCAEPGNTQRQHLAGAARPIPGKYDSLSQD